MGREAQPEVVGASQQRKVGTSQQPCGARSEEETACQGFASNRWVLSGSVMRRGARLVLGYGPLVRFQGYFDSGHFPLRPPAVSSSSTELAAQRELD